MCRDCDFEDLPLLRISLISGILESGTAEKRELQEAPMIGQTISHYHITSKLGEGGMGVVYKAQDTKLNRTVALKFLPDRVRMDEAAKARFLQEAQAAAGLNHNNICTIFGVEDVDGSLFMVMEYVEGGTLRERLPFPKIDEAISIASQIGEALQEAHSKDIVHRDVKADNIMLTAKGQAKVMDFGLARLKGSLKLTRTSSTVGTMGYMAPEQIQGGDVDDRSDIFSFGVLLFEMLTGKLPFRGEHEAAMVYSIVNEEPQDITQMLPDLSPIVANCIQRCLEKDPTERYQHFDDIVADLRRSQKKTGRVARSSSHVPVQQGTTGAPSAVASRPDMPIPDQISTSPKRSLIRNGIIGLVTVVILGVIGWFLLAPSSLAVNPDMTTRVLQVPFTQYSYPSLSPDGKWVAFPAADASGKWDIYYMHVNGGEPRKITADATQFIQQSAHISPDGSQIVYDKPSEQGTTIDIFAISSLGGANRKLVERASSAQWRPDGERVGFIRQPTNARIRSESDHIEFWTVGKDGIDLKKEYEDTLFVARGNYRYNFCWSFDGRSIAWIRSFSANSQVLITRELDSGAERQLTKGEENLDAMAWTKDDRIIFSSNRGGNTNLWVIPASGGEAVQVTKGGGPDLSVSVASNGNDLVYLQQQRVSHVWTAGIDGSSPRQISFDEREIFEPSFSPDKNRVAFVMTDPDPLTKKADVYVMDRDGNNRRKLTNGLTNPRIPNWSPDGRRISYIHPPTGLDAGTGIFKSYVVDADNPGAPTLIGDWLANEWINNDHFLTIGGRKSYITTISTATIRRFFHDSTEVWHFGGGRVLGYYDWRHGLQGWWAVTIQPTTVADLLKQTGDVIMPVVVGSPRKISSALDYFQRWTSRASADGTILQAAGPEMVRSISFTRGKEELLPARFPGLRGRSIEISRDGKEVVFTTPRLSSRLIMVENVFK